MDNEDVIDNNDDSGEDGVVIVVGSNSIDVDNDINDNEYIIKGRNIINDSSKYNLYDIDKVKNEIKLLINNNGKINDINDDVVNDIIKKLDNIILDKKKSFSMLLLFFLCNFFFVYLFRKKIFFLSFMVILWYFF